ncbi:hypothetical protein ACOIDF_31080, partial [Klebsiella pneumoniae]
LLDRFCVVYDDRNFVFMKEVISWIGVGNFYWLMCGYVIGGYVGILGSMLDRFCVVYDDRDFVFMKEVISWIGVGNFYWLMCG